MPRPQTIPNPPPILESDRCECCGAVVNCIVCHQPLTAERRAQGALVCEQDQPEYRRRYLARWQRKYQAKARGGC